MRRPLLLARPSRNMATGMISPAVILPDGRQSAPLKDGLIQKTVPAQNEILVVGQIIGYDHGLAAGRKQICDVRSP